MQVHVNLPDAFVTELQLQLCQHKSRPAASLGPTGVMIPDSTIFQESLDHPRSCITINASELASLNCSGQSKTSHGQQLQHGTTGTSSNESKRQQQQQQQQTQTVEQTRPQTVDAGSKGQSCERQQQQQQQQQQQHTRLQTAVACSEGQSHARQHAKTGQKAQPTLCVEIKPKWGLLPSSPAIPAEHEVRRRVSRFQLQQQLKLAQVGLLMTHDLMTVIILLCACVKLTQPGLVPCSVWAADVSSRRRLSRLQLQQQLKLAQAGLPCVTDVLPVGHKHLLVCHCIRNGNKQTSHLYCDLCHWLMLAQTQQKQSSKAS